MRKEVSITLGDELHRETLQHFVGVAKRFQSYILLQRSNHQINGKSMLSTMGFFKASKGDIVILTAVGPDADQALEHLTPVLTNFQINS